MQLQGNDSVWRYLRSIDTTGLARHDCLVQASWLFQGASSIDSFDQIECPPDPYFFCLTLTSKGIGCCYGENQAAPTIDPAWIGQDARSIQTDQHHVSISLIDSVFANFQRTPQRHFEISGLSQSKAAQRASIAANEMAGLCDTLGRPRRLLMVGVVGRVVSALRDLGFEVAAVDLNASIVGQLSGGAPVLPAAEYYILMKWASVVLVTGMALENGSLDDILKRARECDKHIALYGMTGAHLCPFLIDIGVSLVISESFPFYTIPGTSHIRIFESKGSSK